MTLTAIIYMCLGLTITWGGVIYCVMVQQKAEKKNK